MTKLSRIKIEFPKTLFKPYGNNKQFTTRAFCGSTATVSDESLREIKEILAKYFADKATDAMDKVWEEKNLTEKDMIRWTNEHNRAENG